MPMNVPGGDGGMCVCVCVCVFVILILAATKPQSLGMA